MVVVIVRCSHAVLVVDMLGVLVDVTVIVVGVVVAVLLVDMLVVLV